MVESEVKKMVVMVSEMQISILTKLNKAVVTKSSRWCLSTIYVCNEKLLFKTYAEIEETKEVMMVNAIPPKY